MQGPPAARRSDCLAGPLPGSIMAPVHGWVPLCGYMVEYMRLRKANLTSSDIGQKEKDVLLRKHTQKIRPKLIANMGLFWRKNDVLWRGNRSKGQHCIMGRQRGAKTKGSVNFWHQTGVYALYADYKLVYVGQAGLGDKACIGARLFRHTKDDLAGRWDMFSWFGFRQVKSNNELGAKKKRAGATWPQLADVLEGVLIEVAEPPQNSQKGRFGPGVKRYLQEPHSEERDDIARDLLQLSRKFDRAEKQRQKHFERITHSLDQVKELARKARAKN